MKAPHNAPFNTSFITRINVQFKSAHSGVSNASSEVYAPEYPYNDWSNVSGHFIIPLADGCDEGFSTSAFFQIAIYVMYISVLLVALIGNSTVCFIVQSSPRMRTVTNFFIANLAIGDILMSFFCIPFSFVSLFVLQYWPFGATLCRVVNYSQAVSVLVSAYTLVAISIDRYIAIMFPLKPRISKGYAKIIIIAVWVFALITALPIPIVSSLFQPSGWHSSCDKFICTEIWPQDFQNQYYSIALSALQFILPLFVLVTTYFRIALAVWGKRPPGEAETSRDHRMQRSKRKQLASRNETHKRSNLGGFYGKHKSSSSSNHEHLTYSMQERRREPWEASLNLHDLVVDRI